MARGLDLCSVMDVANGLVRDLERAQGNLMARRSEKEVFGWVSQSRLRGEDICMPSECSSKGSLGTERS